VSERTVRDEAFAVMRRLGITKVFGNPGSSEIPFLTDFPDELEFVLGLHEGSVVGMASGHALGTGRPSFVNLHTAAGLGNAVNAIVCARDNRVPLVIVVGQQDRRHLALGPFLAARGLERLAGDYPVWATQPADPASVPGAIARAWHEAELRRGPALVVVPMGDWEQPLGDEWAGPEAPDRLVSGSLPGPEAVAEVATFVEGARRPALAVGAGADTEDGWRAVVALAERLSCPVWQDTFSSRHGFPQDHPLFAGHLPWSRGELREVLAGHDVVVAIGTPAFRLYVYDPGQLVQPGTRVAVVSDDPEDVLRSRCELAVLAPPALVCGALAQQLPQRTGSVETFRRPPAPVPPAAGEPLRAAHVVAALAERLPKDGILVEEAPSTRPEIMSRIATRAPMGFVAVANGALGFGLAAAVGLRMALPERPVLALLGDGSATYSVQALWSAARYRVGAVFVIVGNARYAIMDELTVAHGGGATAWPGFETLDLATVATGFGCEAARITTHDELVGRLDEAVATLRDRDAPLLLDVRVDAGG
jgi:benzoylformate decarboxylase